MYVPARRRLTQMSQYLLSSVSPKTPDDLSCRYLMPSAVQTDGLQVLVVAFDGNYPDGSLGNAHGHYIARETMCGIHAFEPDCVVIDFRQLAYRWGDTLLRVFQDISQFKDAGAASDEPSFPVVVVTSPLCRQAFLSLVAPSGASSPPWHFEDVDAAITYAVQRSKEWLQY